MVMLRTVKEVSKQTGISVRTLHYYDEIGLLKPVTYSEAGYRLYDDKALETLQQILFFREFELPLKEIKVIMNRPDFDRDRVLRSQREMLRLKKERLERLLASIDDILKGENLMDFTVFDKRELEELCSAIIANMDEEQRTVVSQKYGGLEKFQEHFLREAGSEETQKNFAKVVEWYGDKNTAMAAVKNGMRELADDECFADSSEPADGEAAVVDGSRNSSQILQAYQNRIDRIYRRLAEKMGTPVSCWEVKEIVGEYDFVAKQLYQMKDVTKLMREMAHAYRTDSQMRTSMDKQYGPGASEYIGEAMEEFYRERE